MSMYSSRSYLVPALCAACVAVSLGMERAVVAQPTMTVTSAWFVNDYDQDHPGLECLYRYVVRNTSDSGDINNMISFTISAGSNQGVYAVTKPSGWIYEIGPDSTHFEGNGNVIAPGIQRTFQLYSTLLHVGQGEATAVGRGEFVPEPFNTVAVPVPSYHCLDRDHDVDIDADDLLAFVACVSGPAVPFTGDCGWADLDGDIDVDQSDFGIFQRCLTGEGGGYIEGCETP